MLAFKLLVLLSFNVNFCSLKLAFDVISVNEHIVSAVKVIIEQVCVLRFSTVNLISAASYSETIKDFLNEVMVRNNGNCVLRFDSDLKKTKITSRLKRFNIVVLDGIESFRVFNQSLTPDAFAFNGLYLFVFMRGHKNETNELFETMWKKYIFNVNALFDDGDKVSLYTFTPFAGGSRCGNTSPKFLDTFVNGSFKGSIFSEKFKNMQNCPVKVVTFEDSFAVFQRKNVNGSFELLGFDMEVIHALSTTLNFKKDMKFLEGSDPWGMVTSNGTVTGALGELVKKNAEIGIGNYFLKANRLSVLDASTTYYTLPLVFIIPPGANLSAFKKLLQPFNDIVWIFLLITFSIGLFVILLINWHAPKFKAFVYGTGVRSPITNMLIVILGSSQAKLPRRNFSRFLLMLFSLFCLVQRSIYQGSLYIFLQSDGHEKEVESFGEMVDKDFEFYMFESYVDIIASQSSIAER
jgi:Ligated ion channel L-glutamate- and glycine-binding site